ncbi:MAG: hypothetical protein EOO47_00050 [Flavobacterium sp.]|nr:MAG: hypothetical protein EOO47_00050 [Flavobacterium sp.]
MADNLNTASKKSQNASKIAMLGDLGSDKSEFINAEMMSEAENAVGDFIVRVKENIQKADMIVTGGIEDIRIEVTDDKKINVIGKNWLLFTDRGVNGSQIKKYNTPHSYTDKRPPADVFYDYIKTKNIQLRNNENYLGEPSPFSDMDGDEAAIKSAAYAMATKIYKEGFAPQPIFAVEIPKLVGDLKAIIPSFMSSSITQAINAKASEVLFPTKDYKVKK